MKGLLVTLLGACYVFVGEGQTSAPLWDESPLLLLGLRWLMAAAEIIVRRKITPVVFRWEE